MMKICITANINLKNMYFNIFTIIIVLSNQCLITFPFRMGEHKYSLVKSDKSGLNDCSLRVPDTNDLKTPIPSTLDSKDHLIHFSIHNVHLIIKNNSYFKLTCAKDKFVSIADQNTREITVKCLKGDIMEFVGRTYSFKDLTCTSNYNSNSFKQTNLHDYETNGVSGRIIRDRDCHIRVNPTDFKLPIPYQNIPRATIIRPDVNGILHFKRNISIQLSCTIIPFKSSSLRGIRELTVSCFRNDNVIYKGKVLKYFNFRCKSIPQSKLIMTSHKCQNKSSIAAVGFQVKFKFLILYNICFDTTMKNPLYSWYFATSPHYSNRVSYPERPVFIKSKQYYNDVDIHSLYKRQSVMVLKTVRSKPLMRKYICEGREEDEYFLARGHLVARTEFAYGFEQEATFYYENTVPTWQIVNKNIWKHVESYISNQLTMGDKRNVIVAGTFGICTLPDIDNVEKPLFLNFKEQTIPVPLFIWKMVIDEEDKSAFVFVGYNNPYKKINESSYMCKPTPCPASVLKNIEETSQDGIIFCCTKRSFEFGYGSKIHPIIYHKNLV